MADQERPPNTPQKDGRKPAGPEAQRPRFAVWIYLVIFLGLIGLNWVLWGDSGSKQIAYSTFLDYIEAGHVAEIDLIDDAYIQGKYTRRAVDDGLVEFNE